MLTPQMAKFYTPIQTFEAKQLSVNILDDPDNFYMHNRRYSISVVLQFVYGRRAPVCEFPQGKLLMDTGDCEEIRMIFEVLGRFTQYRRPGSYFVDIFPSLADNRFFNMISNWKKKGEAIFKSDTKVFMSFLTQMQKDIEAGTAPPCFGKEFIQSNFADHGLDIIDAAYTW
jgi:hypothetical protein